MLYHRPGWFCDRFGTDLVCEQGTPAFSSNAVDHNTLPPQDLTSILTRQTYQKAGLGMDHARLRKERR
jgi:hypothetical protein